MFIGKHKTIIKVYLINIQDINNNMKYKKIYWVHGYFYVSIMSVYLTGSVRIMYKKNTFTLQRFKQIKKMFSFSYS